MGIALTVVDDNPHLAWDGRVYPVNATFQRFVAALLDLPGTPVASITSCVPLRDAAGAADDAGPRSAHPGERHGPVRRHRGVPPTPAGPARDQPDDPATGHRRRRPPLAQGARVERDAGGDAGSPGRRASLRLGRRQCGGSGRRPVRRDDPRGRGGRRVRVRRDRPAGRRGRASPRGRRSGGRRRRDRGEPGGAGGAARPGRAAMDALAGPGPVPARLGRAPGRGQGARGDAGRGGRGTDAPARDPRRRAGPGTPGRARVDARRRGRIHWSGHIAERATYLDHLAAADAFVFPSPAEGFPKVLLDAFAVGLPVLATPVGSVAELVEADLVEPILAPTTDEVLVAWRRLRSMDAAHAEDRRRRAHAFVASHTRAAEAARLVERWRTWWPDLPWER